MCHQRAIKDSLSIFATSSLGLNFRLRYLSAAGGSCSCMSLQRMCLQFSDSFWVLQVEQVHICRGRKSCSKLTCIDAQCGYSLYLIISKLTQHIQIPPLEGASWQAERAFGCSGVGLPVRSSLAQKVESSSICLPISHM